MPTIHCSSGRRRPGLWRAAPEQSPGEQPVQKPPSQLTDPELIIFNEQLGPLSWDLHLQWNQHSSTSVDGSRD